MATSGKNASFKVNSTTYDSDDCVSDWTINDMINAITYQCGGFDQTAAGTRVVSFSASLGLAATDTTKVSALAPGTVITTFEAHPAGDTATYIEITSTAGLVVSRNISAPANGIIQLDVEIRLDNVTFGAAS